MLYFPPEYLFEASEMRHCGNRMEGQGTRRVQLILSVEIWQPNLIASQVDLLLSHPK